MSSKIFAEDLNFETVRLFKTLGKVTCFKTGAKFSMSSVAELAQKTILINKLKKDLNAKILAHYYCSPEIVFGVADFCGDSYALSKYAKESDADIIVFCGVSFMAQTASILNPTKKVLLPAGFAGCSLADGIGEEELKKLKIKYPSAKVLCYINSTAEVKALSDVCVTSSNVFDIAANIDTEQIIFVPDLYMAKNIELDLKRRGINKQIIAAGATCCVHDKFDVKQARAIKEKYPEAKILAHPECLPEVCAMADFVGSTTGMLKYVKGSSAKIFAVLSEGGIVNCLEAQNPEKTFIPCARTCASMKRNNLDNILETLQNANKLDGVKLDSNISNQAQKAIDNMFKEVEK